MPTVSITVLARAIASLQALVDVHNQNTGEILTIKQWVIQDLKRKIIAREFVAEMTVINDQIEANRADQLEARFQQLLDELSGDLI